MGKPMTPRPRKATLVISRSHPAEYCGNGGLTWQRPHFGGGRSLPDRRCKRQPLRMRSPWGGWVRPAMQPSRRRHAKNMLHCNILPIDLVYHRPYRSEEHTSELKSLMRISYAVFCLKKKK